MTKLLKIIVLYDKMAKDNGAYTTKWLKIMVLYNKMAKDNGAIQQNG